MKRRYKLLVAFAVVAIAVFFWFLKRSTPGTQRIGFVGFTNGTMGTMEPVFSNVFRADTKAVASIYAWTARSNNTALFLVTNQHKFPINLVPIARVVTQQGRPAFDQTVLLNAPDMLGILLQRYQVATVHVAVLPQMEPWKVEIIYHREVNSYSLLEEYLPSWLGGVPDQRHAPPFTFMTENRLMESEWIGK